ncbi:hypothetical protein CP061683_0898B, partial [Chlamydia psittaci 06-1683]
ISL